MTFTESLVKKSACIFIFQIGIVWLFLGRFIFWIYLESCLFKHISLQFENCFTFANILVFQITLKLLFHCRHSYNYLQNQIIIQFDTVLVLRSRKQKFEAILVLRCYNSNSLNNFLLKVSQLTILWSSSQ